MTIAFRDAADFWFLIAGIVILIIVLLAYIDHVRGERRFGEQMISAIITLDPTITHLAPARGYWDQFSDFDGYKLIELADIKRKGAQIVTDQKSLDDALARVKAARKAKA